MTHQIDAGKNRSGIMKHELFDQLTDALAEEVVAIGPRLIAYFEDRRTPLALLGPLVTPAVAGWFESRGPAFRLW